MREKMMALSRRTVHSVAKAPPHRFAQRTGEGVLGAADGECP